MRKHRYRGILALASLVAVLSTVPVHRSGAAPKETIYRGTASTTLKTYDFCGASLQRRFLGQQQGSVDVTFGVVTRKTDGTMVESNPFGFFLSYGANGQHGSGGLSSALVTLTPSGRRYLAQYWTATMRGTRFSAELTDAHEAEGGSGLQSLWANRPLVPCRNEFGVNPMIEPLAEGATLTGTITGSSASLRLRATTIDSLNTVELQISATTSGR